MPTLEVTMFNNFCRCLMALAILPSLLVVLPANAQAAANVNASRGQVKSMPLMQRPNRPGHFVGNTVRRFGGRGR
jgi:hypothetical protein